jgi:hypothetical protein
MRGCLLVIAVAVAAPRPAQAGAALATAYKRATELVSQHAFDAAARVLQAEVRRAHANKQAEVEARLHDAVCWIRWVGNDWDEAIAENELLGRTAAAAPPRAQHELLLRYWWNRAYLLVGRHWEPSLRATGEAARETYRRLAGPGRHGDGVALLDAFSAWVEGDAERAMQSANAVDASDSDPLHLWILAHAHELNADSDGAAAIYARIRQGKECLMKAIIMSRVPSKSPDLQDVDITLLAG